LGTFLFSCYHKVFDRLPTFDEKNDQFIEMSRIKEEIIKELTKNMKNLVEKMDEVNNMLLAEINDIKDKFDAKFDQIGSRIDQTKDVILAQVNANQMKSDANDEKILAEIISLKNPKYVSRPRPTPFVPSIQISDAC
jgi:hypothetical protein